MIGAAAVVVLIVVARIFLSRPAPLKTNTEQLAISVWAAHGPFPTAHDAEEGLRQACLIVFGPDGISTHEGWTGGHAENFRLWEREGRFDEAAAMMRSALLATARGPAFDSACQQIKSKLRRRNY